MISGAYNALTASFVDGFKSYVYPIIDDGTTWFEELSPMG